MKRCFIIIYDLKQSGKNYTKLHDAIKSYGIWARLTESSWAVVTDSNPTEIRDFISSYINSNDSLFVIKSGHNSAWKNVTASSEWLKKHLKRI